jgi:hypothetical protein
VNERLDRKHDPTVRFQRWKLSRSNHIQSYPYGCHTVIKRISFILQTEKKEIKSENFAATLESPLHSPTSFSSCFSVKIKRFSLKKLFFHRIALVTSTDEAEYDNEMKVI